MLNNKFSLGRVHDVIRIREGKDELILHVDGDPMRIVAGLSEAQKILQDLNEESTEAQKNEAALYFATVIFKDEQARKLMEFYMNDGGCVITICGKYFAERLSKKIAKAQKRKK